MAGAQEKCQGFRRSPVHGRPLGRERIDALGTAAHFFPVSLQLSKRARAILYAVMTEFIATGEPVGSRTLAKKYGFSLSAATIRNVLADLEEAGYLAQPHTSAGRVPTEAAFRLFIDALLQVRELSADERSRIAEWFEDLSPGADIVRETGKLLADLTGSAAVLVRPRIETRTVRKVRFIPTRPGELLSVIVLSDGTVENRYIAVDGGLSEGDLSRVHAMLEESVEGKTLAGIRDHFRQEIEESRDELAKLREIGLSLVNAAIDRADRLMDVVIEGQARLLESTEFASTDNLRELLRTLEERERLVMLLDRTLASSRVQVFLGAETSEAPVSLVAAPYREGGRPGGAVGVIGPTRMDYASVVPLVGATADAMSAALSRTQERSKPADPETPDSSD
ncbi:MAG: heat-inducible transcription repressor HrcA [Myxococcales bacterium]|nr:heat-inducible transcription repressor HrcA [Myxococcales bacterium]MCB9581450.1 heat-inducible transcription repressor HrcA [Polyangiaceae bacterium]